MITPMDLPGMAPARGSAPMGSAPPAAGARLLIVDDEELNRELLEGMVECLGHESELAQNGREALSRLSPAIDLVLLDVMMPDMDGMEVARRIRVDPEYGDLPIIMVTALADKADRLRARLTCALETHGFQVVPTEEFRQGPGPVGEACPHVVVLDLRWSGAPASRGDAHDAPPAPRTEPSLV